MCDRIGTPQAEQELAEFRQRAGGRVATSSFFYRKRHSQRIGVDEIRNYLFYTFVMSFIME